MISTSFSALRQELERLRILREEAPDIDIMIFSRTSPKLALALMRGQVDVAFLRNEKQTSGIAFRLLIKESLVESSVSC